MMLEVDIGQTVTTHLIPYCPNIDAIITTVQRTRQLFKVTQQRFKLLQLLSIIRKGTSRSNRTTVEKTEPADERHFGYEGSRQNFVSRLMRNAPQGSVTQWEHTEREEEEIIGPLPGRQAQDESADEQGPDAMLNYDTVSEKVFERFTIPDSSDNI